MSESTQKPYVLYVAEVIYLEISKIKKNNNLNNIEAFETFIGSEKYKEISSGKFHDKWFTELKDNNYSQRAFDHLWRICENYELWCRETGQKKLIKLNLI